MAGGHNKVECCSGSHHKESSFRSKDLSFALGISLGRGLRRIVARVRGVQGHLPQRAAPWLAVASYCCSNKPCVISVCIA